uniref:Uncharacterized protein n=1 Tax=Setaria viridis TaxID=4556 RepID=A0A4U6VVZ7_SETVI|nr:hypothetical protein SEVIR_3G372050v2 [Setaria viridis]
MLRWLHGSPRQSVLWPDDASLIELGPPFFFFFV